MSGEGVLISIRNAVKAFGGFVAVDDVTLDIRQGEFFSLLGAAGSGKTTLLRMIAGLEATTAGGVLIDGRPMSQVPPYRRPVGMVFQNCALFPHLDMRGNIARGPRRQRLPRARRDAMVDEMLELVQLPGYGSRNPHQLSGGQRPRVALARAWILRPRVHLLDEPLGALDKQLREELQRELLRLQRAVGITFVFVTHDQEEALTLSDRIAVMAEGRVLQVDTPAGLYEAPRSRRVAGFVGSMNFLRARVADRTGQTATLEIEALGRRRSDAARCPRGVDAELCVAIRPERFALHAIEPGGGVAALAGTVAARAYLGERRHYHVRVPGREAPLAVSAPNSARLPDGLPAEGSQVWLTWDDADLIPLDPD
jgi:spermidine/putrescine transport system ATP-binding protein/putrescine transport system ATP-binding protein